MRTWACVHVSLSLQEVTNSTQTLTSPAHLTLTSQLSLGRGACLGVFKGQEEGQGGWSGVEGEGRRGGWGNRWGQVEEGLCMPRWEHLVSSGLRGSRGPWRALSRDEVV